MSQPSRFGMVALTIYVDPDLRDELKILAIRTKKTVQELVVAAIRAEIIHKPRTRRLAKHAKQS